MIRTTSALLVLGLGLVAGCGDNEDLICKPGTFRDGNDCVGADPNDKTAPVTVASPGSLRARMLPGFVVLSSEESGVTIHYTIDGSEPDPNAAGELSPVLIPSLTSGTTIKFFGVDPSGNAEATHEETYTADTTGPGRVTNLAASVSGTTATVTWTNPTDADYAGTLLLRVSALLDAEPVVAQLYTAPTALSSSVQAVLASSATMFADTGLSIGATRYVAYTYDDLGNYSEPVLVEATAGATSTTATFTFDTATDTLVLTSPPPGLTLTASTADRSGTTVTLHLSATNLTGTYFQNPKILVTSVTNGAFTEDGTINSVEYKSIGPNWFAPGATVTKDLVFTGASGVVTITFEVGEHPSIIAGWHKGCCSGRPHQIADAGSTATTTGLVFSSDGRYSGRRGGLSRAGIVVGQHFYDVPTTEGSIERWDMTTMTRVGGISLASSERTNIMSLLRDSGARTYAVVREGGYRNGGRITKVVRMNEALRPTAVVTVEAPHGRGATNASISPDEKTLAIPAANEIVLVDLTTFTLKDADPSTPDIDRVVTTGDGNGDDRVRDIAWLNDSSGFVGVGREGGIYVIKLTSTGYTETFQDQGSRGVGATTLADGRVWIGFANELVTYTPSTGVFTTTPYSDGVSALTQVGGALWVLRNDRQTLDRVDGTGAVLATATYGSQTFGHWLKATKP